MKYKKHSSNNEWTQCWKHSGNGGDCGKLDNQREELPFPASILSSLPGEDSSIHSFNEYLLNAYYILGSFKHTQNRQDPCSYSAFVQGKEISNKKGIYKNICLY